MGSAAGRSTADFQKQQVKRPEDTQGFRDREEDAQPEPRQGTLPWAELHKQGEMWDAD